MRDLRSCKGKSAILMLAFGALLSVHASAQVVIGEVDAYGSLEDNFGEREDWIELFNEGLSFVDLTGWQLSDDPDEWDKWALPPMSLAPGERVVVFASGRDIGSIDHWECPADDGDTWRYLLPTQPLSADWRTLDFDDSGWQSGPGSIGYGDGDDAVVVEDASTVFMRRTFSVVDVEELAHGWLSVDYDDGFVAFLNGREIARSDNMENLSIAHDVESAFGHEAVLYQGGTPDAVPFDPREWLVPGTNVFAVQVHNTNQNSSDLTARPFLALGRSVPASIPFGGLPEWWTPAAPPAHTNFKLKPGEPVILSDGSGNLADLATLPWSLRSGVAMSRVGEDWCFTSTPTPGAPHQGDCAAGVLPPPEVEPASGWYDAVGVVAVAGSAATPGVELPTMTLRFTTDGSEPDENSTVYTGLWTPSETTVLSIRAFGEGHLPSETVDRTYFIGEPGSNLQTVSIATHPDHLWDWETGIYVMGPNAGPDYPYMGANFWQPWSKVSRLEWFDATGIPVAEARFDLEIHGGWSRAEPQRSFRLDFKPHYSGPLEHTVFASKPWITEFGNLNLRNGGQASWENKIQDAFFGELALETDVVASAWRPVEVYLNGEYWGIYGAREKSDEQFVEDNFGWGEESVDLHNQWVSLHGAPSAFEASVDPILELPSGSAAFHDAFAGNFDVGSYIDYHIFQIHGQNVDWMLAPWGLKNLKYFRASEGDGLWRPILFDTDACFGAWGTSPLENYLHLALFPPYPSRYSELLGKVLDDPEYGCRFATRTCDLLGNLFEPSRFNTRLSLAAANMSNAMIRHVARWGSPVSIYYWETRLQLMRDHNEERADPERDQVRQHLGFSSPEELTVNWSAPFAGEVQVNGMRDLGPGWSAPYFGECPIRLAAIPIEGQGFLGWQSNIHTDLGLVDPADPFIEVALEDDDTFFALFGPCMEGASLSIAPDGAGLVADITGAGPVEFTWYLDGVQVASGPECTPSTPGEYLLTASNAACTLFSAPWPWPDGMPDTPSSIPTDPAHAELAVMPNPAQGAAMLLGTGAGQVTVFGPLGQQVYHKAVVTLPCMLPAEDWEAGVYTIVFRDATGMRTVRMVRN